MTDERTGPPIAWYPIRHIDRGIGPPGDMVGIVRLRLGRDDQLTWFNHPFRRLPAALMPVREYVIVGAERYYLDDLHPADWAPSTDGDLLRFQRAGALKNQPEAIVNAIVAYLLVMDTDSDIEMPF